VDFLSILICLYMKFYENILLKRDYKKTLLPLIRKFPKGNNKQEKIHNILHVNTVDSVGGAAKIASWINNELNSQGYNSKILVKIAFSNDNSVNVLKEEDSIKQKLLLKLQDNKGWLDFFHVASLNIKNLDLYKECNILHLHNIHGGYFSPFALPELSSLKPTIWTLHDEQSITGHCSFAFDCERWLTGCGKCENLKYYPDIKKDTTNFLWQTKKNIYEHSNLTIVCPSNWLKQRIEKSILKNQDIRLIYNGINEKIFTNTDKQIARQKLNLPHDKKILLFSANGSIKNPQKGGEYLIQTYETLSSCTDILFVNIGGQAADNNQENWLDIPYITEEETLALYYSASDLFIYPSLADSFGLVVAESLSCGTPVIAFKTGGIPEIVDHLKTGYIAEQKNSKDFINGIKLFLDNPDLRKNAGIEGRSKVENNFTLKKMVDSYIKLYSEFAV
jgi:glycosyltransferase involved in cell wall biosynthesis